MGSDVGGGVDGSKDSAFVQRKANCNVRCTKTTDCMNQNYWKNVKQLCGDGASYNQNFVTCSAEICMYNDPQGCSLCLIEDETKKDGIGTKKLR
jgi:hypothetical protein